MKISSTRRVRPLAGFKITSTLLLVVCFGQSFAQINKTRDELLGQVNTITTAVPFLLISPDARSAGLADCGVATTPDPNSTHWNPAKLSFADKKMGFAISYTP